MFGYTKQELLGKSLDMLMPELYIKGHRNVLSDKITEFKKLNLGHNSSTKGFKADFRDIFVFGKNKSRYLIPLNFKVSLVPFNQDQNGFIFAAKLSNETFNYNNNLLSPQSCFVITNTRYQINSITASCINILGFSQNIINTNPVDLTKFIKELYEENIREEVENANDPDLEEKMDNDWNEFFKNYLVDHYRVPRIISFRRMEEKKDDVDDKNTRNSKNFFDKYEDSLKLNILEIKIHGKVEGYVFKFEVSENQISDINQTDYHLNVRIDKNFIPDINQEFFIDAKKMAYIKNPNIEEAKKFIKEEANRKIKPIKKEQEKKKLDKVRSTVVEGNSDEEVSSFESNSDNDADGQSSEEELSKPGTKRSGLSIKNKDPNGYYTVNFTNMKLLCYDFKSGIIKEYPKDDYKISQVEMKKNEDFKKSDSNSIKKVQETNEKEKLLVNKESLEITGTESILVKQIEYALTKQENQPTIVRMRWICLIIFVIFLSLTSLFLALFISAENELIQNFDLINYSFQLLYNTVIGVFHVKELTLLMNSRYTNYFENINEYYALSIDILTKNFNTSNSIYTSLISSPLNLSYSNQQRLQNEKIHMFVLDRLNNTRVIDLTLSSAFVEANTALFQVSKNDISSISSASEEVYFYLINCENSISLALFNQAFVFMDVRAS